MKTAVSIPDPVFEAADRLAARRGVSRSELYAQALRELLERDDADDVTARLDAVYGAADASASSDADREFIAAGAASLAEAEW